ncbi:MAG: hypothetical protein B7Z37_28930 [Verrucomicrobia bacterium 12-59-8]|nr:MAG: hypothetical protein B7Z37_28930 [Verrucomicrobia bacterium 12-59-8]
MFDYKWLAGGMLVGGLMSVWNYLRGVVGYLVSILIVNHTLDADLSSMVWDYLNVKVWRSPLGRRRFNSGVYSMRATGRSEWQAYEGWDSGGIYWHGWSPIWLGGTALLNNGGTAYSIVFLRGTVKIDTLLTGAVKLANSKDHSDTVDRFTTVLLTGQGDRVRVMQQPAGVASQDYPKSDPSSMTMLPRGACPFSCGRDEIGVSTKSSVQLGGLALCPEAVNFVEICRRWRGLSEWYGSRQIPWKLGANLVGPPGSGKTSLVRAIARELNMPVYVFSLGSMDDNDFREAWGRVRGASPAIAVLDDIDNTFNGREPVGKDHGLRFDTLLQSMSGMDEADGLLMIVTTNKPESLDEALIRPGRAEYPVYLGGLDPEGVRKIATRILIDWPELIEQAVDYCQGLVGAAVQQHCIELASKRVVEKLNGKVERQGERAGGVLPEATDPVAT